jgi:hypothetical protein
VAVWALFGIKFISGHAKNIVALDAHPVNVGLRRLRLLLFRVAGMLRRRMGKVLHGGHYITRASLI